MVTRTDFGGTNHQSTQMPRLRIDLQPMHGSRDARKAFCMIGRGNRILEAREEVSDVLIDLIAEARMLQGALNCRRKQGDHRNCEHPEKVESPHSGCGPLQRTCPHGNCCDGLTRSRASCRNWITESSEIVRSLLW